MYRRRLRPAYTEEQLQKLYSTPHDHNHWWDHKVRVDMTIALGRFADMPLVNGNIVDLSCGNGTIAIDLSREFSAMAWLGDYARKEGYHFTGPLEKTLDQLQVMADLYVCSETIEHLDDPDAALRKIRANARQLLLSTPIGETNTDNPEHYWGWDQGAVEVMLEQAGWTPKLRSDLCFAGSNFPYNYQIWLCK